MLDQTFDKIKNINHLYELRLPMLFLGLAIWVVTPIIGNIPILLSIQLYLLTPKARKGGFLSINNLLLVLVILSSSIYISSFHIFADTRFYLDIYDTLDIKGIFDNQFFQDRYEFVLFLLLYPIHILTNGSEYLCLFLFSLIVNSAVVFYVSKKLSHKYYPTLLIIVFSTFFYYSQVFYMRQFLSILLVMMALASMESSFLMFMFWSILAIFSHLTAGMYIGVCLMSQLFFYIKKNVKIKLKKADKIFIYIAFFCLIGLVSYVAWLIYSNPQEIYSYTNNVIDLLPEKKLSSSIQNRVTGYDGRDTDLFQFSIFRIIATVVISIFIFLTGYKKLTPRLLALDIFFVISLLQISFILVTGFNQRIVYLFLVFYGLFMCIGLNDQTKIKPFGVVSLLTMFMAAANTFSLLIIQINMIDTTGWSFFNGQPLSMSIYDYVIYFFQSI